MDQPKAWDDNNLSFVSEIKDNTDAIEEPTAWESADLPFVNDLLEIKGIPSAYRDDDSESTNDAYESEVESEVGSEAEVAVSTKFIREKQKRKYREILKVEDDFI